MAATGAFHRPVENLRRFFQTLNVSFVWSIPQLE
jgi:hypothetical protein